MDIGLIIVCICCFMIIRATIALSVGLNKNELVHKHNQSIIMNDFYNYPDGTLSYGNAAYEMAEHMLSFHKWTFKQFYPNGINSIKEEQNVY